MIQRSQMRKQEPVFTWVDARSDLVFHIASERLALFLQDSECPVVSAALDKALVDSVATYNGTEAQHLAALALGPPSMVPAVLLDFGDGTHILADGNHRLLDWHRRGWLRFPARIAPPPIWERFRVAGMPGTRADWESFVAKFNFRDWVAAGKPGSGTL